jgi:elongation factor P hydroxylase
MTDQKIEIRLRALNQLLSVVAGARYARETNKLKSDPIERIKKCLELTLVEHKKATDSVQQDPETAQKAVAQVRRKLDSLQSLLILSECVEESSWEPMVMGDSPPKVTF